MAKHALTTATVRRRRGAASLPAVPSYSRRAAAYLATGSLPPPPSLRSIVSLWAMGVTAGGAFLAILGLAVMP